MIERRTLANLSISLSLIVIGCIALPLTSLADGLNISEIRGETKNKSVSVLQNRYFQKAWRPEFGIVYGPILDEAYVNTRLMGVRGGMFINEWVGFELQYLDTTVSDTEDRKALNKLKYRPLDSSDEDAIQTTVSPDPEVNVIRGVIDANAIVAPFYGKVNLFDWTIIYSDFYLTSGFSRVETDQGEHFAITYGAGQRFYFNDSWSLRVDFKNRNYEETRNEKNSRRNAYSIDFGASYFFM